MAEDVDVSSLAELVRIRRDEDLLRERLEKMESRKDAVSEVVYRRVKGDYESRRAALESEARAPRERAGREYAKLRLLSGEASRSLEEARLAREEVDFRHELGEFAEEDYAAKRKGGEEIASERQARVDELARIKERFLEAFPSEEELERAAGPAKPAPAPPAAAPQAASPQTPAPPSQTSIRTSPMPASAPVPEPVPGTLKAALGELSPSTAPASPKAVPAVPSPPVPAAPTVIASAPPPVPAQAPVPPAPAPTPRPIVLPPPPAFSPDATVAGPERSPAFSPDATALGGAVAVAVPARQTLETRSGTLQMTVSRILVIQEDGQGPEYVLKPEPTSIGRAPDSAIRLPYPDVSRQHAMVFPADGAFKIVDRGSPNGLFVNGSRVKEHELKDGDVIQVGRRKLIYRT